MTKLGNQLDTASLALTVLLIGATSASAHEVTGVVGGFTSGFLHPLLGWGHVAAIIVGAFAIFHGYAHGSELPGSANAIAYAMGFVIATGLLHLCGILFGLLGKWELGRAGVRAAGVVIAVMGAAFLAGAA
ncbi:MAG: HupE/UreJ family protein [Alphaproteobacteria bacterium]|nr:HupE/UreJ family protein [Alphaproteobacteria bacterium]